MPGREEEGVAEASVAAIKMVQAENMPAVYVCTVSNIIFFTFI